VVRTQSTVRTDNDFYRRGRATLLAVWVELARASAGASLLRLGGVAAAVFPTEPERSVYNNAVLDRGLGRDERAQVIHAMEAAYAEAGVDRFAAWVHESDGPARAEFAGRGYRLQETTRVMAMSLGDQLPTHPEVEIERLEWSEYVEYLHAAGLPDGFLADGDPAAFHVLGIRRNGDYVASAIAFDHDRDCGIYNMSTLEPFRRQGLGTALLTRHLQEAADRGCSTASLQSTPIAEGIYASVGFRDLGRYFEYVPVPSR
jgi:GNAT superfamily N-acetyltransferase